MCYSHPVSDQDAKIEDLRNTFENAVEFMMTSEWSIYLM